MVTVGYTNPFLLKRTGAQPNFVAQASRPNPLSALLYVVTKIWWEATAVQQ